MIPSMTLMKTSVLVQTRLSPQGQKTIAMTMHTVFPEMMMILPSIRCPGACSTEDRRSSFRGLASRELVMLADVSERRQVPPRLG